MQCARRSLASGEITLGSQILLAVTVTVTTHTSQLIRQLSAAPPPELRGVSRRRTQQKLLWLTIGQDQRPTNNKCSQ